MSPRPKRQRRLKEPPFLTGFVPENNDYDPRESITLLFEEYEALKLADYENLSQLQASKILEVSRPTFTRIYDSARKKIAKALVEHKRIGISGGDVIFKDKWYACTECESVFKLMKADSKELICPVCHSKQIVELQYAELNPKFQRGFGSRGRHRGGMGQSGNCICPKCNYSAPHQAGEPCNSILCPHCNIRLVRENSEHHLNIINKKNNNL